MKSTKKMAGKTGLEPATSTVTGWHSNQLSYFPAFFKRYSNIHWKNRFSSRKLKKIAFFPEKPEFRRIFPPDFHSFDLKKFRNDDKVRNKFQTVVINKLRRYDYV